MPKLFSPKYFENYFLKDFLSSIVVFLIALPLCLGIAIASGLPPVVGIITGIIGGIVVGSFAGCPLQVSGPAAGLITITYEVIKEYGIGALGILVIVAGLIQIIFGVLKLAPWFQAVSPAVINGMLSGIGVLIFASQFHVMIDDNPKDSTLENLMSIPQAFSKSVMVTDNNHHIAASIGILTLTIMLVWKYVPKQIRIIPAALTGVVVAVIISQSMNLKIKHVSLPENIWEQIQIPDFHSIPMLLNWEVLLTAITIAFIASAETLLTCTAVDRMHSGKRADYNKEIISQGIGNTLSGLVGGMPITGVIVRSAANVDSGARSRMSTIIHGFWLASTLFFLSFLIEMIPISSLAAILVFTSFKLMNFKIVKVLYKYGKSEIAIYAITILIIVFDSLLEGVIIGIIISGIKHLYRLSKLDYKIIENEKDLEYTLEIHGAATFVNLPSLTNIVSKIPTGKKLHIKFHDLTYIDHACFDFILNFDKQYIASGGTVILEWDQLNAKVLSSKSS